MKRYSKGEIGMPRIDMILGDLIDTVDEALRKNLLNEVLKEFN